MFAYAKPKQRKESKETVQKKETEKVASTPNLTGIPEVMKTRSEKLSKFSFNDVRVHYNSDKPAQLQALAYTQGNPVYVEPGQEQNLGYESRHIVQQKQGRVRPTMNVADVSVNNATSLEREADNMTMTPVIQCRFSTPTLNANLIKNNYNDAARYWAESAARVRDFADAYDADLNFTNPHMERNMYNKARKAKSVLAGESFETHQWRNNGDNTYSGPGPDDDVDIKTFPHSQHHAATGARESEIKTSSALNWRDLFRDEPAIPDWIAYLEGDALVNARANMRANGIYFVYDKNNVNAGFFRCD